MAVELAPAQPPPPASFQIPMRGNELRDAPIMSLFSVVVHVSNPHEG